jgi:hypothetical protein
MALPQPIKHLALNALLHHNILISYCFIGPATGDSNPGIVIRYERILMPYKLSDKATTLAPSAVQY